jgi:hypothetical protein
MAESKRPFDIWIRLAIITSLSWPFSLSLTAILAGPLPIESSSLPFIILTGSVIGLFAAFTSWIAVRQLAISFSRWTLMNVLGVTAGITVAYWILSGIGGIGGLAFGGIGAGATAGTLQSLGLRRAEGRVGAIVVGALSWTLALALGGWLAGSEENALQTFAENGFLTALMVGWSIAGGLLVLAMIALSPLPRAGYPRGQVNWWY